ncbi:hypothetical protein RHMOL_Rhmol06G0166500 [Rhododendron molle]|uniref:Uncharacterized protein n=1 Tax=Rhododendron molle TaxID=49168 RepID=A0ACC0NFD3_RHOML|nr:hypothetical protein RHMOL_Rhmol06G0166500 [Rhododendron molle]
MVKTLNTKATRLWWKSTRSWSMDFCSRGREVCARIARDYAVAPSTMVITRLLIPKTLIADILKKIAFHYVFPRIKIPGKIIY